MVVTSGNVLTEKVSKSSFVSIVGNSNSYALESGIEIFILISMTVCFFLPLLINKKKLYYLWILPSIIMLFVTVSVLYRSYEMYYMYFLFQGKNIPYYFIFKKVVVGEIMHSFSSLFWINWIASLYLNFASYMQVKNFGKQEN